MAMNRWADADSFNFGNRRRVQGTPPQGKSEPSGREVACALFGVLKGCLSGLPYRIYEKFEELVHECRGWVKEPGVVLITEEEYARRAHPETATASTPQGVPQAVGGGRGSHRSIFDQVDDLKLKIQTTHTRN